MKTLSHKLFEFGLTKCLYRKKLWHGGGWDLLYKQSLWCYTWTPPSTSHIQAVKLNVNAFEVRNAAIWVSSGYKMFAKVFN